jgi:hypothetical protein
MGAFGRTKQIQYMHTEQSLNILIKRRPVLSSVPGFKEKLDFC